MVFKILLDNSRQALYVHWVMHQVLLLIMSACHLGDLCFLKVELEGRDAEIENIEVAQIRLEKTEVSK